MTINEIIEQNIQMPTQTYGDLLLNERGHDVTRILNSEEKAQYEMIKEQDRQRLYMNENMLEQVQKETVASRINRNTNNKPKTVNMFGIEGLTQIM